MREQLEQIRKWAQGKLDTGQEPPWAWYQYMKLRETLDAILAGSECITTENSPQSGQHPETHLRLVDSNYSQDSAPHRLVGLPTQPPM